MKSKPLTTEKLAEIRSRVHALVEPSANPSWDTLQLARDAMALLHDVERLKGHAEAMADTANGCEYCYTEAVLDYRREYPVETP